MSIALEAEDPRALAVSPAGDVVYAAVFESGNGTTILDGTKNGDGGFPPNVVSDPVGPWGGVNPPPNAGASFDPAQKPGNPVPPKVGLIVREDESGSWVDDNGGIGRPSSVGAALRSRVGRSTGDSSTGTWR